MASAPAPASAWESRAPALPLREPKGEKDEP